MHSFLLNQPKFNPTMKLLGSLQGVSALDPNLLINSVSVEPTFRYKGGDADGTDWAVWDYGETLDLQAGTVPSFNQGSPCIGVNDDSVKFNDGGYYQATGNDFADVTTEDLVFEIVFKLQETASVLEMISKRVGATQKYQIYINTNESIYLILEDGSSNSVSLVSAPALSDGWYHAIGFVNRDEGSTNGSQWYINSVASGAGKDYSAVGSITTATPLVVGGGQGGVNLFEGNIAYVAMWKQSDWHQAGAAGPAEWATIAAERFARLTGIYPSKSEGTVLATTVTRATTAMLDKLESGVRKLYQVGSGWLRTVEREDSNGDTIKGYLAETAAENLCLQSQDLATTWVLADTGTDRIVDGDMEEADVASWTVGGSATLTKDTTDPHSGSKCLRVAYNGTNNPFTYQSIVTIGHKYRVTGWFRGDGTVNPRIYNDGAILISGTTSTDWQAFDETWTVTASLIRLYALASSAGYCEFDDIQVIEIGDHFNEQLEDGDMEGAETEKWTAGNSATLTKETGTPHGGSQCLRVAYNGTTNPYANQDVFGDGTYRITGWARGDGTIAPKLNNAGTGIWTGTTSSAWQYINVVVDSAIAVGLRLYALATGAGYAEFDDIKISEISMTAPDKSLTAMSFVVGSTNGPHRLNQAVTVTAATWVFSVFAKKGDQDWILLYDGSIPVGTYFDLDNGVIGSNIGSPIDSFIEPWGDGWYRCAISFTGTAAGHAIRVYSAEADNDFTFSGDGTTITTYFWGAQVELGAYMSSYVPTTTATVTRNKDELTYKGDDGNLGGVGSELKGTIVCDSLTGDYDLSVNAYRVALSDGGSASERIISAAIITGDVANISVITDDGSNGAVTGTTDVTDGVIHNTRATWETNSAKLYVDGVAEGAEDTTVAIPDDLDEIAIGQSQGDALQLGGVIGNIKIYSKVTTK